uniref:Uncharacterized protein n=1 Tax=Chromera velia CCMP2878 TaxID=1169474 RepID=A0A0G4IDX3_9ALVE|eukprot:Cvel_13501.t1-p1 / transcript=Cvel_13501.t1 / gene=Cvel_13501 / organism=Chromera_velia_CCMP2878 / gene_product=hypothetical protein / transcript_product=hypothetical protein / location=Cvel_scaffold924:37984-53562(-) / protein_length=791 / sequence_SO=supercontig / SO=protein_coding / is_pseudo=false
MVDHAPPIVGVEEHIEVSLPDVSDASGQAGQGDPPPPVPPVSDPPHLVAEAFSGDSPPAPLPALLYPLLGSADEAPGRLLPHRNSWSRFSWICSSTGDFCPSCLRLLPFCRPIHDSCTAVRTPLLASLAERSVSLSSCAACAAVATLAAFPRSFSWSLCSSCDPPADQIYDPLWLFDTLDSLYLSPYESRVWKRWRAIKVLCPLASESIDTYFARAAKVFCRLRRLVPAMVFGSEPFVPFEYNILLESLPTQSERGAHRYVLAHLWDYTPMGLRDYLRRYEQQLGTPTPSATICFSSAPPSRSSSTPKPNHPKYIYCGVAHPWRKHVKYIACGVSPHADRSTCPAIAHVCGCGKQGHLDAMCPSKLRASKKATNVHCATVSFASTAVTSPDLVHGPHFGKDDGATVEAVSKLYLEKVSASITYTVKALDTPVLVRTAGHNNSSEASGAVVYAIYSITLDDVIFGDRLESITFLILPQSSIPFLFSKALAQRLSVKMDYKDNIMVIPSPSGPDVTLTWIDLREYYGLPLVQDNDSPPSLVGLDESDDECPPLKDNPNESEDKIDNSAPFRPLPFTMCTTTSPTTTLALHSPPEGIVGVGVSVSTGEAPEGVRVCVSRGETPEGVCMSVSPEEASVPSGEGVEGLKEPARPGWRDSTLLPSSADAALTLLQEQEAAAFVPLFGPNPMIASPLNTVMVPVPPIPAPLPPADLPAVHVTDPPLSSPPTEQPIPESTPPATPLLAFPFPIMPAPLQPGTMVIGRSPEHSLLWVGEIFGILPSDGAAEGDVRYEVHA